MNFLDIVKNNNADWSIGLIDEALRLHPELAMGDTRAIAGIHYDTIVRTAIGNATGSFRRGNEGIAPPVHTYENRRIECYLAEPRFQADKGVADSDARGAAAVIATDVSGTMEGEMQALASQFYYGAASGLANAKGYPGLIDAYDATNMVVDAGGTTANTGSSVWLVRFGPQQVQWVLGNGGKMAFSPVRVESLIDANNLRYDGYVQTMVYRPGVQVGSLWSACRIKKLTADAGATLTDTLLYQALAKFKAGTQPDAIFMSRRSLMQLRQSRTTYNPMGTPAPAPTSITGLFRGVKGPDGTMAGQDIPIYVTEAISETEPLTL